MITPFNEDGSVDYAALTHLVNDQIDNGAGFICALGTTGETPCLTPEECNEIKRTVVKTVDGRVPVLLGISDNCTARLVNTVKNTDLGGVDGILSAAPSYNKPVQEGIYRHFMALSQASPLPIVLYNIPGRTGVNISADTVLRLVNDTDNIVAVKEASGNITQIADILQAKPDRFDVLSGDDAITYEMLGLGAVGVTFIQRYTPSKEAADLSEVWNVEGNEIALLYNYELQETKGLYENGESYLPISWVNEHVNKRFYWDEGEQLLVYALPDQIVYADLSTMGSSGAPLLLLKENEVYLTLGLVSNYTNVQISAFDSAEVKRIFVTDWGERETAKVKRDGAVRELGGIKSPVLTNAAKGQTVTVLETMEKWSRVATEDGCIGYIENRRLEEPSVIEFTGNFTEPVYESTRLEEKIVLGWHQVTSPEANGQLEQVVSAAEGLNVIAPTWFSLTDNEGNYRSLADREYVEKAHEMGLQVWALLDNFSNQVQTEVLLSSTSTRRKLINSLIADAAAYDLDGLNMDFEGIKEEAGVHYIQFLRELSIACREEGLIQHHTKEHTQGGGQQGEYQQHCRTCQTAPPQLAPPGETAHQVDAFAPLPVPEIEKEGKEHHTKGRDPEAEQAAAEELGKGRNVAAGKIVQVLPDLIAKEQEVEYGNAPGYQQRAAPAGQSSLPGPAGREEPGQLSPHPHAPPSGSSRNRGRSAGK